MKKLLSALLVAALPFVTGAGASLTGGSSSVPNILKVCSSGTPYQTLQQAIGSLPIPIGEPIEAGYQSDATITLHKITTDGIGDALFFSSSSILGHPATAPADTVNFTAKKTGSPVGNLRVRICKIDGSGVLLICASTSGLPGGGILASSTVAASSIGTAGLELVSKVLDATVYGKAATPQDWGIVIDGDDIYDTNDFTEGTGDYIEVGIYSGGTSERTAASGTTGSDDGEPYYDPAGTLAGPMIANVTSSTFSETTANVISLCPGTYEIFDDLIPPHTAIVSEGRSGILHSANNDAGSFAFNYMGDSRLDSIVVTNAPRSTARYTWRGEQRVFRLNAATSTASTSIVTKSINSEGDDLVIGSVVMLSESGKPTTFYRVVTLAHTQGIPGTTTITADRNIQAVYTTAGASVTTWLPAVFNINNSLIDIEFRNVNLSYVGSILKITNSDVRVPKSDFFTELPAKATAITIGNRFSMRAAMGGSADAENVVLVSGGVYESHNDILEYSGTAPASVAEFVRVSSGSALIRNISIANKVTGANNTLEFYHSENGGTITIDTCYLNPVSGAITPEINNVNGTVVLKNCNMTSPTLNGGATLAQLTASPAFSTPVAVDGTSPDTIAVPGAQTTSVCSCGSPTAACAAPVTGIVSVTPAAGSVSVAYDTGCTSGGNKTVQCKCEKSL